MNAAVLALGALLAGLVALIWSSDRFVDGAAALAKHFAVSPLVIGMVIIGFGTSAPEMIVGAFAALEGKPGLALGNAYGSNIANIALVLGASALLAPIQMNSAVLKREIPILAIVTFLSLLLMWDGNISRPESVLLLLLMVAILWIMVRSTGPIKGGCAPGDDLTARPVPMSLMKAALWTLGGLALLLVSSQLLVWGAVRLAEMLGVSDLVIGLTIIALGTSLPEVATALSAARQGKGEMALGSVLGSNIFNCLAVVGIAGVITPIAVEGEILRREVPVQCALLGVLFWLGLRTGGQGKGLISRRSGGIFLLCYMLYFSTLTASAFLQGSQQPGWFF